MVDLANIVGATGSELAQKLRSYALFPVECCSTLWSSGGRQ